MKLKATSMNPHTCAQTGQGTQGDNYTYINLYTNNGIKLKRLHWEASKHLKHAYQAIKNKPIYKYIAKFTFLQLIYKVKLSSRYENWKLL